MAVVLLVCTACKSIPNPLQLCAKAPAFEALAPRVEPQHRDLTHWTQTASDQADVLLLEGAQIRQLNQKNQQRKSAFQNVFDPQIGDQERVSRELDERVQWLLARIKSGHYVETKMGAFGRASQRIRKAFKVDEFRVVTKGTILHCIPMSSGLFTHPMDTDFNRNHCSGLHPSEIVRVLRSSRADGWVYVHTGHSVGWVDPNQLTPAIAPAIAQQFRDKTPRLVVLDDHLELSNGVILRMGANLPLLATNQAGDYRVQVPHETGLQSVLVSKSANVRAGFLPFTRRNLYALLFSVLDAPYGWGGRDGGRDCSRLILDVFSSFGIQLGRHSTEQSRSGIHSVELKAMSRKDKLKAIRAASKKGVLLLYMRGHIMVYLNESGGRPYAISSISEYMRPCAGKGEQVVRLDRVAVTDLELGRETCRRSFLNRLERLAVFSK